MPSTDPAPVPAPDPAPSVRCAGSEVAAMLLMLGMVLSRLSSWLVEHRSGVATCSGRAEMA